MITELALHRLAGTARRTAQELIDTDPACVHAQQALDDLLRASRSLVRYAVHLGVQREAAAAAQGLLDL